MLSRARNLVEAVDELASSLDMEAAERILATFPTYRFEDTRAEIESIIEKFHLRDGDGPIVLDIRNNYDGELMFYGPEEISVPGLAEGCIILTKLKEKLQTLSSKIR